jgi:hypothetical protein
MIAVSYGAGRKRWTRASLLFDSVLLIHQAAPHTPVPGPESLKSQAWLRYVALPASAVRWSSSRASAQPAEVCRGVVTSWTRRPSSSTRRRAASCSGSTRGARDELPLSAHPARLQIKPGPHPEPGGDGGRAGAAPEWGGWAADHKRMGSTGHRPQRQWGRRAIDPRGRAAPKAASSGKPGGDSARVRALAESLGGFAAAAGPVTGSAGQARGAAAPRVTPARAWRPSVLAKVRSGLLWRGAVQLFGSWFPVLSMIWVHGVRYLRLMNPDHGRQSSSAPELPGLCQFVPGLGWHSPVVEAGGAGACVRRRLRCPAGTATRLLGARSRRQQFRDSPYVRKIFQDKGSW